MRRFVWLRKFFKSAGPGVVTGASDDDPSGIITYAQTGALFGYAQLWLVPFAYPFMVAVQEMCGRIGLVCGTGLSGVLRAHYPRAILWSAIILLLVANVINIGADLGAMAASMQLITHLPFTLLLFGTTAGIIVLQVLLPYAVYARFLKYLALSLVAYIGVALIVVQDWAALIHAMTTPQFTMSRDFLLNIAAVLGTTISPYLFFWQADEEVEEEVVRHEISEVGAGSPHMRKGDIPAMRFDTMLGMFVSQFIAFCILVSVAATLGIGGMHELKTAADAAEALRPIAGEFASLLFAIGIVGTGLLAVPVLAGSVSYAIAEALQWKEGLGKKPEQAPGFYLTIALVTIAGIGINFTSVGSITLLYWAAIANGLLAPPLLILLLIIGNNKKILGAHTNGPISNVLGVIIAAIMTAVAAGLLFSLLS